MRHFFLARPVAALSRGVAAASRRTILVTLPSALKRESPGLLRAVLGTIDLAAVAAAADHCLGATTGAQKQPR